MKGEQHAPWITAILIALVLGVFALFAYFNPRAEYALGGGIALAHAPMAPVGGLGGRATRGSRKPNGGRILWTSWARADTVEVTAPLASPKAGSRGDSICRLGQPWGWPSWRKRLQQLRSGGVLRILHFGDSQIEGDRITGDLRDALQALYGGEGAGMQPLVPFVPMAAVAHTAEGSLDAHGEFWTGQRQKPHQSCMAHGAFPIATRPNPLRAPTPKCATVRAVTAIHGHDRAAPFPSYTDPPRGRLRSNGTPMTRFGKSTTSIPMPEVGHCAQWPLNLSNHSVWNSAGQALTGMGFRWTAQRAFGWTMWPCGEQMA